MCLRAIHANNPCMIAKIKLLMPTVNRRTPSLELVAKPEPSDSGEWTRSISIYETTEGGKTPAPPPQKPTKSVICSARRSCSSAAGTTGTKSTISTRSSTSTALFGSKAVTRLDRDYLESWSHQSRTIRLARASFREHLRIATMAVLAGTSMWTVLYSLTSS